MLAVCRRAVRHVPAGVTPNQVTLASFLCTVAAGVCAYLAGFSSWWFIGASGLLFAHWFFDNLDGVLARERGLTSEQGFFLDLFLDALGYTVFFLGAALARYSIGVPLALLIAVLIRELLLLHWMMLRQRFEMPLLGPSEMPTIILVLVILTVFWPRTLATIGGLSLGWIDAAAALATIAYSADIAASAVRLYRHLDPPLS